MLTTSKLCSSSSSVLYAEGWDDGHFDVYWHPMYDVVETHETQAAISHEA